jgi:hypothetical protein
LYQQEDNQDDTGDNDLTIGSESRDTGQHSSHDPLDGLDGKSVSILFGAQVLEEQ